MNVGASLDLRFDETVEEFVEYLLDLGLSHVEIRHGYLNTHPDPPSPRRLRELGRRREVTWTFHAPHIDSNPGNLDERMRQVTAERIKDTIDMAVAADAGAVIVHGGSARTNYPRRAQDRARDQTVKTLRDCARYADAVGMPLAIENQRDKPANYRYTATPDRLRSLLEEVDVDSPYLGVAIDVGHAKATGVDYTDFVDVFGEELLVAHLHDNDGTTDSHDPLPAFRQVAAEIGAPYAVLEMKSLGDIRRCVEPSR